MSPKEYRDPTGIGPRTDYKRDSVMKMHYIIRGIAGTFVLASLVLGYIVSPWWLLFTAFVGLNLLQSSFTRWCLMENILERLGVAERADAGDPLASR
jgi:hypothetical protein